ncbi:protein C-terminal S-isoprenylcysteine carboxyl O-methyltransferase [Tasmannia lanceolata]|uniref:protein C-terminal S-isoprenylcysteine carboxyl O-methyltransferase n=1 Tax=Tasmannia lanceolata TaxID=3420 RepID=UPI0040638301
METTCLFLHPTRPSSLSLFKHSCSYSQTQLFSFTNSHQRISLRPNNKHLTRPIKETLFSPPLTCSYSTNSHLDNQNPQSKTLKIPFSPSLNLSQLTPLNVCKWTAVLSFAIAATKWTVNLLSNPFFWMYFSWTWLFWPWFLSISLAIYSLYCLLKHSQAKANIFEQLIIVTSTFTWLTLVPPAHFNGFLEGWPLVFFFVYHYFFFFNATVRKRLYGDFYPRPHEPKWDIALPTPLRVLFSAGVLAGHWLAASEGTPLHLVPGGWSNVPIWVLIVVTLFMQYHSTLYLANYSEKVVVPTAVVQFGPYRWVRHPIYASTMLLFATYCVALRAPLSLLFVIAVCLAYYDQKAKLEEGLMVEAFGESYKEYASKVRYKFIPLVY